MMMIFRATINSNHKQLINLLRISYVKHKYENINKYLIYSVISHDRLRKLERTFIYDDLVNNETFNILHEIINNYHKKYVNNRPLIYITVGFIERNNDRYKNIKLSQKKLIDYGTKYLFYMLHYKKVTSLFNINTNVFNLLLVYLSHFGFKPNKNIHNIFLNDVIDYLYVNKCHRDILPECDDIAERLLIMNKEYRETYKKLQRHETIEQEFTTTYTMSSSDYGEPSKTITIKPDLSSDISTLKRKLKRMREECRDKACDEMVLRGIRNIRKNDF